MISMLEIQSCVRGYHVYKDSWTPFVDETLACQREEDNGADPYAVAVMKESGRTTRVVGHVPRRISAACCLFLRRNGIIDCKITGSRRYSADLVQGELEVPCKYTFRGEAKYISKLKILLEPSNGTSKICEAEPSSNKGEDMSVVTPPYKKQKVDCNMINLEEIPATCIDNDVNSLTAPWQSVGRITLNKGDREYIISGDKLNDKHMHFAQILIKQQFKHLEGLKYPVILSTLGPFPTTTNALQILHTREDHWIVTSTVRCAKGEINIYDSLYKSVETSTANLIAKLFGDVALKMKTCPRQYGDKDCGAFAIAICAAIIHGINLEGINFIQENMRQHLLVCFEQQHLSPFPYSLES